MLEKAAFGRSTATNHVVDAGLSGGLPAAVNALLTTVAGLIVAVILQLFYNYCISKIDALVNQMEDASISMVDLLVKNNHAPLLF